MNISKILCSSIVLLSLLSCSNNKQTLHLSAMNDSIIKNNPLLAPWQGENGGFPPLNNVKLEDIKPAIECAIEVQLAEIDAICTNPDAPTFENTIAEYEKSGVLLDRVMPIYAIWSSNMSDSSFQVIEQEIDPKLYELEDKIYQNTKLFTRIETIKNIEKGLTAEQKRLTDVLYKEFIQYGVKLDSIDKAKVTAINQQLATLFTKFGQNLLADENEQYITFSNASDMVGLSQPFLDAAAKAATEKGQGKWLIYNTRSSVDPFLTFATNRAAREKVWKMFVNRGDNGNKNDNNAIVSEIVKLRSQRAKLLGYKSHAHLQLDNTMAKTPERALELMEKTWTPAVQRVAEEVADMQAVANTDGQKITIEPWDYHFYSEKVRKARYDLNQNEVKEYFQLDKMREAMFWVANQLFNYNFTFVSNVPTHHPDVTVWEVTNSKTNAHIGYWYFDAYARTGKRSGAWMMDYREQSTFNGTVTSMVSNNSNFVKANDGEPVLLSWDDAETLFHEFGHALHGLSSNVTYPSLSGTNVVRDYVEFPSQVLERWLLVPEVLKKFAVHYKTGQSIPDELVVKIKKAAQFKEGFKTVEYLSSALVDMHLHMANIENLDVDTYEKEILKKLGMPKEVVMRHRLPQFAHLFSSDSYSAAYYSYIWAEVISADAYDAFTEAKNPFDSIVAAKLYKYVFSAGNTIDPEEGYKQFRGRGQKVEALMRDKGFIK